MEPCEKPSVYQQAAEYRGGISSIPVIVRPVPLLSEGSRYDFVEMP